MTEEHFRAIFTGITYQKTEKIVEKKKEHEEEPEDDYNDTDSAGSLDGEEILGSDDDEQENPKDYKKVRWLKMKDF